MEQQETVKTGNYMRRNEPREKVVVTKVTAASVTFIYVQRPGEHQAKPVDFIADFKRTKQPTVRF